MPPASSWSLHSQLDADCTAVADLRLCRLLLCRDANYPWLILVPRRPGATEIIDLDAADRVALTAEIDAAARALRAVVPCDKLNIAALGNMVPQLHVHVIARRTTDAAWPRPVWGAVAARSYDPPALSALVAALRGKLTPDAPP
jgi:diadenosine tetraphosphate (Ap4A) HIT family hydrolase